MITQNSQNSQSNFYCEKCDYTCSRKSDYNKHIATAKHINSYGQLPTTLKKYACSCGKEYKHRQGLYLHKKTCKELNEIDTNTGTVNAQEITFLTNKILEVIQSNSDLQKQNQDFQQQMLEVYKNGIMNNTNNIANISNCNNKSFNLQFFLNETCKDALNMKDFIDSIQIKLSDLENMGKLGFVNGLSNIIIDRLNALDVHMRPIHCTDTKRDTVYTKEKDQWTKEEADLKTVRRFIQSVAKKNTQNIGLFRNKHPDCMDSSSRNSDIYNKIVMETYGGYGNNDTDSENKIIMKLVKEIAIDKYR